MNLLRIGQEAVANAIQHGGAHQVRIQLQYASDKVRLSVSDDGRGFAVGAVAATGHFGLLDMKERAQMMGCQLLVESEPGRGTCIAVEVPMKSQHLSDEKLKADSYSGR
jgi:signal transduction histidine kinase